MSYQNDIDGLDNLVKSGRMSASDAAAMKDKLLHNMNNFIPHRKGGLK
jgi:polyhydroxyalkanoate synthesis regulator phasin